MSDHPIQGLMKTAMEQITEMVNVNTVVGDPVETPDGSVIMPISRVGFGFAAGGSEFGTEDEGFTGPDARNASVALPFGGGSGGGVSITPIAFLVVGNQGVKIVPLDNQTHIYERLIDLAPQVVEKIQSMIKGGTAGAALGGGTMGGMMSGGTMSGGMSGSGMTGGATTGGAAGGNAGMQNMTGQNGGMTGGMAGGVQAQTQAGQRMASGIQAQPAAGSQMTNNTNTNANTDPNSTM